MKRNFSTNDTIAAISTPVGEGGIGIVRLSGKKALSIADKIFTAKNKIKPSKCKTYTTHYGYIMDSRSPAFAEDKFRGNDKGGGNANAKIDEVILTVMRSPKSYTKEDVVEINCHGGVVALRKALELALSLGARIAEPGEFTKRAFINGRIDLAQAEATIDIIRAKTESSMKLAFWHLEGEFSDKINNLKEELLDILGEVEAQIDFSEEDIEFAPKDKMREKLNGVSLEVKKLVDNAWKGMILREGILCVISGKPNVGKSSLMNILLKMNRVIVTPIPGTTRDAIEEEINLKGIPLRIVDTAGISRPRDTLEKHGIQKSRSYIKMADIVIFMLDSSKKWSKQDEDIFNSIKGKNLIIVANKSDLAGKLDIDKVKKVTGQRDIIEASLLRKKNLKEVEEAISRMIWRGEIVHPEGALVTNLRHKKDLERAGECMARAQSALKKKIFFPEIAASEIREAVSSLGAILGDTVEPDILDRVFSRFCVGK